MFAVHSCCRSVNMNKVTMVTHVSQWVKWVKKSEEEWVEHLSYFEPFTDPAEVAETGAYIIYFKLSEH